MTIHCPHCSFELDHDFIVDAFMQINPVTGRTLPVNFDASNAILTSLDFSIQEHQGETIARISDTVATDYLWRCFKCDCPLTRDNPRCPNGCGDNWLVYAAVEKVQK